MQGQSRAAVRLIGLEGTDLCEEEGSVGRGRYGKGGSGEVLGVPWGTGGWEGVQGSFPFCVSPTPLPTFPEGVSTRQKCQESTSPTP